MRRLMVGLRLLLLLTVVLVLQACTSSDATIEVGATAPDFTLQSATGEIVSLSDFSGQPVLLFFHMAVG